MYIYTFISDCPQLECLKLEGNFSSFLSDHFFDKVMTKNNLNNLKIFDLQGTPVPLTILTAKHFLSLPNLCELRVSCWKLSELEYKNLIDKVRMSGWDLKLSRYATSKSFTL